MIHRTSIRKTLGMVALVSVVGAIGFQTWAAGAPDAPKVADKALAIDLKDLAGTAVSLADHVKQGPVAVIFLRGYPGYQCPLCTRQVGEYIAAATKFKEAGARVLFVYPGPAEKLLERAGEFAKGKAFPEHFDFVLDPDYAAVNAWKLRWEAAGETAYPAAFVVDTAGVVRFANVSNSHGGRTAPAELLKAITAPPAKP